jgi:hypothetical protein
VAGLWLKIEIWGFFLNNGIFVNIYETGATTLFLKNRCNINKIAFFKKNLSFNDYLLIK